MSTSKRINYLHNRCEKWRKKALMAKRDARQMKWQLRALKASRAAWKEKAKSLEGALKGMQPQCDGDNQAKPAREYELTNWGPLKGHRYPCWQIQCSIELYLRSSQGFRSIGKTWFIMSHYMAVASPSFSSIRQWVLRLGYYKLQQSVEQADDWILILDYTLQMGLEQCLLILGVRRSTLVASEKWHPDQAMMQVLDISLTHWPNATHVEQRLSKVIDQTGCPIQVVADGAKAIQNGIIAVGQQNQMEIPYTYDITHLVAIELKKLLKDHPQWKALEKALNQIQKSTQQTQASFLAPPSLRKTARYMNLFKVVQWTNQLVEYQQKGDFSLMATQWHGNQEHDGTQQFEKRFAPLKAHKTFILQLQQLMELIKMLLYSFKTQGLSWCLFEEWQDISPAYFEPLARRFWQNCLPALKDNIMRLNQGQTYLASSDIIESIFGTYKAKGQNYWLKGITDQILFIPAFVGAFNPTIVQKALVNTSYQDVLKWYHQQRPDRSFLAKRRQALGRIKEDKSQENYFFKDSKNVHKNKLHVSYYSTA